MYPVNQVFLGSDPLLSSSGPNNTIPNIEEQINFLRGLKQLLEVQQKNMQLQQTTIWDDIDKEVSTMTNDLKAMLFLNLEYADIYNELLTVVLAELLNLVKVKIENSKEGKELLSNLLKLVKKLKAGIVESTNRELELFKKFKEYSLLNPNIKYDEFIKMNIRDGNKQSDR